MITLYGFALSNYYNKTKLALLEKGIPFNEEVVRPSQDAAVLKRSPLGKIPFIKTDGGYLSESQAILEYLEDTYPEQPLYPANVFERAKCREFIQHLELNVELVARRIYGEALFGAPVSQEIKDEVRQKVEAGLEGVMRLARFSPYVLGESFTAADIVAWLHLGLIGMATQKLYGENLVAAHVPGIVDYFEQMESRPHVKQVAEGRDAAVQAFFAQK
ncbi:MULTISPECIES: glutathione S-transferase family protein [Methylomicrobium]|uniref:Glutathione S-transferase n=1 Tax=Methylomicrobium album BG8 TaxID=686340 RepID=H8GKL7_METAL|nr:MULTISPECIES: glutathione S-transferase [Methylomicrobium]EIC28025.1 glutathione S-transferase [Methylomicrobium album BG8]